MKPTAYRIVVEGELGSPRYSVAFAEMRLEAAEGTTEIVGMVEDEAVLEADRSRPQRRAVHRPEREAAAMLLRE